MNTVASLPMTADLVARLRECIGNEYMDETARRRLLAIADEMEAASALRSSGEAEPFAFVDVTRAYSELVFPRAARKGSRGNRQAARELPVGLHPLYLHPATPASAWRPIAEAPDFRSGTFIVTNRLGEVAPMVRGVIQNNPGESDWTFGEAITEWQHLPTPPTSAKA